MKLDLHFRVKIDAKKAFGGREHGDKIARENCSCFHRVIPRLVCLHSRVIIACLVYLQSKADEEGHR
jgi:hypothetical protein